MSESVAEENRKMREHFLHRNLDLRQLIQTIQLHVAHN